MTRLFATLAVSLALTLVGPAWAHGGTNAIQNLQHAVTLARPDGPSLRDSIGADVEGAGDSLDCHIEAFCTHVLLGEWPRFRVRITNRSHRAVLLVRPADGAFGREFPRSVLSYEGPPDGVHGSDHVGLHADSLRVDDFVALGPGKHLDLFGASGLVQRHDYLTRPGRYVARFQYGTAENDLRLWLGSFQPDSLNADWRARFRRVPRVDLHAECAFEVQQR